MIARKYNGQSQMLQALPNEEARVRRLGGVVVA